MTDWQREFVRTMRQAGLNVGLAEWMADWFAAIACLESGWGRYIPKESNNPIGYHWLDGMGWKWVTANEGMTGSRQRYRVFRDYEDAARSWLYLVERSKLPAYVAARAHAPGETDAERDAWILAFSRGYCPADPKHGAKVKDIYRRIRREVAH